MHIYTQTPSRINSNRRKWLSHFLLTPVLFCGMMAFLFCGCHPPEHKGSLLPYLKSCTASSSLDKTSPTDALDGSMETGWSSSEGQHETWLELHFITAVTVERVTIFWGENRATDYAILSPANDYVWNDEGRITSQTEPIDNIRLKKPFTSNILRIRIYKPSTACSIQEIQITGRAPYRKGMRKKMQQILEVTGPPSTGQPHPTPEPTPLPRDATGIQSLSDKDIPAEELALNEELLMQAALDPKTAEDMSDDEFLDLIAERTFGFFWWESDPQTGLTRDRARNFKPSTKIKHSSVAATGFALAACVIGVDRGWISREEAIDRVRNTLASFDDGPVKNIHGIFPHFVNMNTGKISPNSEYSSIDTALLLAGMIPAMEYFDDPTINTRGTRIFNRINWPALRFGDKNFVSHGLTHSRQHFPARWGSMSEGILVYLMAIGSPTYPLPPASWYAIDRHIGGYRGYDFYAEHGFQSIFRFQYPALFFDFRGLTDTTGIDYFLNVRLAVFAMRDYCIQQAAFFPKAYGPDKWGLGAADGPGNRYYIYGFPPGDPYSPTDGSIIPYAIAGSIPFAPSFSIRALRRIYDDYHDSWGKYGFADCINPEQNFIAHDVLGLDAGATLLGIDAYQDGLIWKLFMQNKWIRRSIKKMGMKKTLSPFNGTSIDLMTNGDWLFYKGNGDFAAMDVDDTQWVRVDVPDRWENISDSMHNYDGIGWYRCHFTTDPATRAKWSRSGKPLAVLIGGIDDADIAFLNGTKIGATPPGKGSYNKTRIYKIQAGQLKDDNVLAFKVVDQAGSGGIWLPPIEIGIPRKYQQKKKP